jgi:hypothetical protein
MVTGLLGAENVSMASTVLLRAFELGADDAYARYPYWNDDLERRLMTDWQRVRLVLEADGLTEPDRDGWLQVRETVRAGWEDRHVQPVGGEAESHAVEPATGEWRLLARELGARETYQAFPWWCDDLERRLKCDWEAWVPDVPWLEARDAIKAAWDRVRQRRRPDATVP